MMWQTLWPMRPSTAFLGFSSFLHVASTKAPVMRSATLSGWHGFTFSNMASSFPCLEQTLHQIVLGRDLAVIGAAVFLYDLKDLVPEPYSRVYVVDADVDKRRRDWLLGGGMLGEESHAVGHLLALNPAGAAHGAYRSKSCGDTFAAQPTFFNHSQVSVYIFSTWSVLPSRCLADKNSWSFGILTPSTSGISSTSSFLPPGLPFSAFSLTADLFLPAPGLARRPARLCYWILSAFSRPFP